MIIDIYSHVCPAAFIDAVQELYPTSEGDALAGNPLLFDPATSRWAAVAGPDGPARSFARSAMRCPISPIAIKFLMRSQGDC